MSIYGSKWSISVLFWSVNYCVFITDTAREIKRLSNLVQVQCFYCYCLTDDLFSPVLKELPTSNGYMENRSSSCCWVYSCTEAIRVGIYVCLISKPRNFSFYATVCLSQIIVLSIFWFQNLPRIWRSLQWSGTSSGGVEYCDWIGSRCRCTASSSSWCWQGFTLHCVL